MIGNDGDFGAWKFQPQYCHSSNMLAHTSLQSNVDSVQMMFCRLSVPYTPRKLAQA